MIQKIIATLRETNILIIIPTLIGGVIVVWEYIKMAKGKSCLWWIEKAERAKKEGRTIIAKLDDYSYRSTDGGNDYILARYEYNANGKIKNKVERFGGYGAPPETITLYYDKNPRHAKTYDQYTHVILRHFWPWIAMIIVCGPISWVLGYFNLVQF